MIRIPNGAVVTWNHREWRIVNRIHGGPDGIPSYRLGPLGDGGERHVVEAIAIERANPDLVQEMADGSTGAAQGEFAP